MNLAGKTPSIRLAQAKAAPPEESIDRNAKAVHPETAGRSTVPASAQERTTRMAYVTQDKFNEAIDHLGHHIDRRLTALETEVKSLRTDMVQGFERVDQRFEAIDQRFDGIDQRFDGIDQRFDGIDRRLDAMDQRFDGIDRRLDAMDQRFDGIDRRLDTMDRRFDTLEDSLAASNKVHNDNHLELKQMLGVLLQEIRNK